MAELDIAPEPDTLYGIATEADIQSIQLSLLLQLLL